jgi:hypothetical protein
MADQTGSIPQKLIDAARRHSGAEADGDMAGTMETLELDCIYDLYPVALRFTGIDMARRYYENYFANVAPRIVGYKMVAEWIGPEGINQEYDVVFREDDGVARTHRILGILTFGKDRLSGERIYSDETMLRAMFGPIWSDLTPISS